MDVLRMVRATQSRLMILNLMLSLVPYPNILYVYICMYVNMYIELNLISQWHYFIPFLSYMLELTPQTILGCYIVSWCRVQRLFCYSCVVLGGWARLLSCCEVVSLHHLEGLIISLFFFYCHSNFRFFLVIVGGMSWLIWYLWF